MSKTFDWTESVTRYLEFRRAMGYLLQAEEKRLYQFAQFAEQSHAVHFTTALAAEWSRHSCIQTPITWERRLEALRGFAKWLRRYDLNSEIPPSKLFCAPQRRLIPHIYTNQELVVLLEAAGQLAPTDLMRPSTCRTVFGLLAATGLRISEAMGIKRCDFYPDSNLLYVREGKTHKERWVVLHSTVTRELQEYSQYRDSNVTNRINEQFFLLADGRAAGQRMIRHALRIICKDLRWKPRGDYKNHRLHDFRHTFIVQSILQTYRRSINEPDKMVLALSTYVGHAKVEDTYWYFTGIPELMAIAADHFWRYLGEVEA